MDPDLETDVSLSAAETFELAFSDATNLAEVRELLRATMADVRKRYPGISEQALGFAIGCAFGRHDARGWKRGLKK